MAMLIDDQIRRNRRSTVKLFIVMFIILWALVASVGYVFIGSIPLTAGFALIFGLIYLWSASSFSVTAVLKAARAKELDLRIREHKMLDYAVEEMAIAAQIPKPKVYIQESNDINAFATGRKPEEGVICVTTGALKLLNKEELQGVIAHEMAHIKNEDIKVATYAIALIGIIAMIAEMVWYSMFFGRRGGNDKAGGIMIVIAIALMILAPILSRLTYMAINRRREYLADASGAEFTRNPEGLASALQKISGTEPEPHHGDRTVASLYLANPFKRTRKESIWSTHPPIDERIRRLRGQR